MQVNQTDAPPQQLQTDSDLRAEALLARMTLAEKIGQMTQIEKNSITPEQVRTYAIGSVLSGGGGSPDPNNAPSWARMVRDFQEAALESRLAIPLIYGVDAVHGHNNVYGATIFPHNVGLGAGGDEQLVERVAHVAARELLATNIHWDFAPAVSVPRDIRWGRSYEGFSEDTGLVSRLGVAYLRGLQGSLSAGRDGMQPVLGCPKHFVGDGGTSWGSNKGYEWIPALWRSESDDKWKMDQGATEIDEATLRAVHLPPYQAAIAAGARNIMVSYSSWDGLKMHAHRYLLTDVLKGELGFEGFLISDWLAVTQLDADSYKAIVAAINAGLDMVMVPFDYKGFIENTLRAVEAGDIPLQRIDDAVRRILKVKLELGLFEQPFGDPSLLPEVGSPAHREVAREAVRKSLVLLKNTGQALPLARSAGRLFVAGRGADDIGIQCGGWTIEWLGKAGPITPGTTLLQALRAGATGEVRYAADGAIDGDDRAEVGIVVLAEQPYAEGEGDCNHLELPAEDLALVQRMRTRCEKLVVVLYSGRPRVLGAILDHCDAFVAAWLPGTEGQGIADVLFGDYPFSGKLPYRWPRSTAQVATGYQDETPLFPFGYGLA